MNTHKSHNSCSPSYIKHNIESLKNVSRAKKTAVVIYFNILIQIKTMPITVLFIAFCFVLITVNC